MARDRWRWALAVALACAVPTLGCAGSGGRTQPRDGNSASAAPPRAGQAVVVPTTYVSPTDASTIAEMFEKAKILLVEGKFAEAAEAFDRIVALEPSGPYAAASLFNAGLAFDQVEDRNKALERFQGLVRRFPQAPEARHALIRTLRLLSWQEAWPALGATADVLLAYAGLTVAERVEAHGSRALAAVQQGDLDGAMMHVSKARTLIEDNRLDDGKLPIGAGPVYFALGEVRRIKGERITFVPVPGDFAQVLEERCQLLLDAQDAYSTTMRTYDPHWGAMAGYRVGQLYQQLHRDVMAIPPPAQAKTLREKQLFEGAMRLRYRVLIEKGMEMMERTLRMAERTGEHSSWVSRARDAKADLGRAFVQEKEALARLPYSEADLKQALEDLAKKKTP